MPRLFLYGMIFIISFATSFFGAKLLQFPSPQNLIGPALDLSPTEKSFPSKSNESSESIDLPFHKEEEDSVNFIENSSEDIELMVDVSLPSLKKLAMNNKELKKECKVSYPQYQKKNRYQWAKSYTISKTQTKSTLDFYVQDDLWSSFSRIQQQKLMEDLFYCDPVVQINSSILSIRILSASDDSILSSYTEKRIKP